jgi:hypothetical protein
VSRRTTRLAPRLNSIRGAARAARYKTDDKARSRSRIGAVQGLINAKVNKPLIRLMKYNDGVLTARFAYRRGAGTMRDRFLLARSARNNIAGKPRSPEHAIRFATRRAYRRYLARIVPLTLPPPWNGTDAEIERATERKPRARSLSASGNLFFQRKRRG